MSKASGYDRLNGFKPRSNFIAHPGLALTLVQRSGLASGQKKLKNGAGRAALA
jgi:hypothetical protein